MADVLPRATRTHREKMRKVIDQFGWPRNPVAARTLDMWLGSSSGSGGHPWTPSRQVYMLKIIRLTLDEKRLQPALREGFESLLCDAHSAFGSSAVDMLADLTRLPAGCGNIAIAVGGNPVDIGGFADILEGLILTVDALATEAGIAAHQAVSTAARRIEAAR